MSAQTVEINSVETVLRELKPLVEEVQRTLEQSLESDQPAAGAEGVTTRLNEIRGTLQLLDLDGPKLLVDDMGALANELAQERIEAREAALEVLLKAVFKLPDYLDRLQAGQSDRPAVLLPLVNELRGARGAEPLGEREVFRPQLEPVKPRRDGQAQEEDAQIRATAKRLRPRFQRALLGWYRGQAIEDRLNELGGVLQELAHATANPATQRLWRVCGALTESLSDQGLEQDTEVKVLMAKVERLLSQLVREGEGALERTIPLDLLRSLLYYVARSGSDSARVREVKQAYNLEELLPDSGAEADFEGPNRGLLEVVGQGIRDDLTSIRDSVEIYVHSEEGRPDVLEGLPDRIRQVADTFSMVGLAEDHGILRQEADGLAEIEAVDADEAQKRMQRLADVLVRADSDLTELESGRPVGRKGQNESGLAIRDLPDSEYRPLLSGVVAAALDDLSKLREAIGAYCGDPEAGHEAVAEAPTLLTELEGAVAMLPLEAALPLVRDLRNYVERELVERGIRPEENTQVLIADVVAGLEYYLEAVDHDRAAMTHLLESAQRAMTALQEGGDPQTHSEDEQVVIQSPASGATEEAESDAGASSSDVAADAGAAAETPATELAGDEEEGTAESLDAEEFDGSVDTTPPEDADGSRQETDVEFTAVEPSEAGVEGLDLGDLELEPSGTASAEADPAVEPGVGGGIQADSDLDDESEADGVDLGDLELVDTDAAQESAAPKRESEDGSDGGAEAVSDLETGDLDLRDEGADSGESVTVGPIADDELDAADLDTGDLEPGNELAGPSHGETRPDEEPRGDDELDVADLETGDIELSEDALAPATEQTDAPIEEGPAPAQDRQAGAADLELEPDAADEAIPGDEVAAAVESPAEEPETVPQAVSVEDQAGAESGAVEAAGERAGPGVDPAASGSQYAIVGEDVDDEIVEVFLEEALGELDKINEYLPKWKANPGDEESLVVVRRAFHTLKGGGRLIGAELVGEFSWSMENMLNRVIDHSIDATATLFDTLDEAAAALPQLIEQIRGNRAPIQGIDNLIQRAHALSRGEEPPPGGGGGSAGRNGPPPASGGSHPAAAATDGMDASPVDRAPTDVPENEDTEVATEQAAGEIDDIEADPADWAPVDEGTVSAGGDAQIGGEVSEAPDDSAMGSASMALESGDDRTSGDTSGDDDDRVMDERAGADWYGEAAGAGPQIEELEVSEATFPVSDTDAVAPAAPVTDEQALSSEVLEQQVDEAATAVAGSEAAPEEESEAPPEQAARSDEVSALAETAPVHPDEVDGELLESFLEEAEEILETCDATVHRWREDPDDPHAVAELERSLHTLKGGARMAELAPTGELTHELESLIYGVDEGSCPRSEPFFDVLQEGIDTLTAMVMQARSRQWVAPAQWVLRRIRAVQHGQAPTLHAHSSGAVEIGPGRDPARANQQTDLNKAASPATGEQAPPGDPTNPSDADEGGGPATESQAQAAAEEVDDELVQSFLEEADELIDACEQSAERWRDHPEDDTSAEELQRYLHTLKGGARMAELGPISEVSHELESVVDAATQGICPRDAALFDVLQEAVDALMGLLTQVRSGQGLPTMDELVGRLRSVREGASGDSRGIRAEAGPSERQEPFDASATGQPNSTTQPEARSRHSGDDAGEDSLVTVFAREAETHQAVLRREFLDNTHATVTEAKGVTGEILRALHTLVGSAETAGCDDIAAVAAAMEQTAKSRRDAKSDLTEQDVSLFGEAVVTLDRMLEHLVSHPNERLDTGDLPQRLAKQRDQAQADLEATQEDSEGELVDIFLEEADELLEGCDQGVSRWREQPEDTEVLGELQRSLHTLKGGARMAHLPPIADLTHEVESVIKTVEDGGCDVSEELFDLLQEAVDALTVLLEQVRGRQPIARVDWLVEDLQNLRERGAGAVGAANRSGGEATDTAPERTSSPERSAPTNETSGGDASEVASASAGESGSGDSGQGTDDAQKQGSAGRGGDSTQATGGQAQSGSEQIRVQSDLLDNLVNYAGEVSIYHSRLGEQMGQYRFNLNEFEQTVNRLREQLRQMEDETEAQILYSGEKHQEDQPKREDFDPLEFDRYTRIQELSRSLSESVGDLDSIKEILENLTRDAETLLLQQSRVSSELQDGLMQTRMVRFDGLRARLSRVVRQTASQVGKKVQMSMTGGELEVDRSIQERVVAPLEHVLRNAVSHGIETPSERGKAGKPEQGSISLDLHRGGTDVVLEITDDGGGIDPDAVRRKAINRGLIDPDDNRDDNEVIKLILETGFSTADEVTQISGRGVGMDVVDAEIRRLGGTLGISTVKGQGTRFTVRLPVTLAINQAVLVKAGDDTYAIPIASIEGVTQVTAGDLKQYYIDPSQHLTYAEAEYRVQHLGSMLGTSEPKLDDPEASYPVIMVRSGDERVALHIDGIQGRREVVVKPLGTPLNMLPGISGATIMADGSVVLILDVGGLLRTESRFVAAEAPETDVAAVEQEQGAEEVEEEGERTPTILVVDDSITMRKVSQRILTRNGLEVATAKDGVDAMSWMGEQIPDLILLDIEMPRMDGYEVASNVRSDDRLKDVPIIMVTSRTGDKHRQRAEDIGVNQYLGKPYQEVELMEEINALIGATEAA